MTFLVVLDLDIIFYYFILFILNHKELTHVSQYFYNISMYTLYLGKNAKLTL